MSSTPWTAQNLGADACASSRRGREATRPGSGRGSSHDADDTFTRAGVKGSLRRPPAALDPGPPAGGPQLTHSKPRSPLFSAPLAARMPLTPPYTSGWQAPLPVTASETLSLLSARAQCDLLSLAIAQLAPARNASTAQPAVDSFQTGAFLRAVNP